MAFWNLSVTIGNLWVLVANAGVQNSAVTKFIASPGFGVTAFQMFFFAVFAFAAALAFGLVARTYSIGRSLPGSGKLALVGRALRARRLVETGVQRTARPTG